MGELQRRPSRPVEAKTIWTSREVDDRTGRVTEIHHHYHAPDPAPERKPNAADRFTPYFVIMAYLVVIVGALGVVGMMIVPPFMAAVLALTASFVAIVISAAVALVVIAAIVFIVRMMLKESGERGGECE